MKTKAMVFDMDGTLLMCNGYDLHPETLGALKEAYDSGIKLIIATGRPLRFALPIVEELGCFSYIITNDGSNLYELKTQQSTSKAHVEKEIYLLMVKKAIETNSYMFVSTGSNIYKEFNYSHEEVPKQFIKLRRGENFDATIEWFENIINTDTISQITLKNKPKVIQRITNEINEELGDKVLEHYPTSHYLSAMSSKASKLTTAKELVESIGIKISEVMAFGDSSNDIKMLEGVGYGVCVGNGKETAKAVADEVIGSHDTDAIAKKIREVISNSK
ncbi:HAD family hydrolase [Mycoplasma todarodis]|uniref:Cof-type HAD-IIB family hydrolase n=1 Tax=Mycoplasma todarodis TaxID=1937191 RepID=A0A4R0XUZ5_9MOLU|nr:HAD family hydrolase [Mycoplasma todarodis]TCG10721.1 hypothetical protein C4B25_03195 [Mycoplasma todarodis]